jgi:hypothetical protein
MALGKVVRRRAVGLDLVEFVMAVEEAFQIAIPDEDAQRIRTPGELVTYIIGRVAGEDSSGCLEQRAFYKLRRAAMQVFAQPRTAIKTTTRWVEILPGRQTRHNWNLLHRASGTSHWPRLTLWGTVPEAVATLGGTARYLAEHGPATLKRPEEGWTRRQAEDAVKRLMREHLSITDFRWDQDFVKDLRVN